MFQLVFDIPESPRKIRLKDPIFSIGSCFSDNIGRKLSDFKFDVVSNPLGVIYNPYSIFKNIRLLLSEGLDPENFVENGGVYYHWDTHSAISGTNLETFRSLLEERARLSRHSLIHSRWMIISLGTIYAYKYLKNAKVVANCHQIPQTRFDRITLSAQEIVEDYFDTMEVVRSVSPEINLLLTVSPVRHVRDGLIANNISKAVLIQATSEIVKRDPLAYYFPAYELMIDVLRDYRFYKEDMIHPNDQAIEYIWERFIEACMDTNAKEFVVKWTRIRKSLAHRPFHPHSENHQSFLKSTIKQLQSLEDKVDVSEELIQLTSQLNS